MDIAWSQVGECQKIVEKLINAKVRTMPADAKGQVRIRTPMGATAERPAPALLLVARLRFTSTVTVTRKAWNRPKTRKLMVRPCQRPMITIFRVMQIISPVCPRLRSDIDSGVNR